MWITQTYLGIVEPDANLFVYYFFEDYDREQQGFTKQLQRGLEDLGEVFDSRVSLMMPNPRFAGRVESEVRENKELWQSLHGKLPGIFLSNKPLIEFDISNTSHFFITFDTKDSIGAIKAIAKVRQLANEKLSWDFAHNEQKKVDSWFSRLADATELKPGAFGFRVDLKKLRKR